MCARTRSSSTDDRGPLLGALLRRAHETIVAELGRGLAEMGIVDVSFAQLAVLRLLWDHPAGLRASSLAARANMTKPSMGALVDQLEATGHVERIDDETDARAKLVRLTRRGRVVGREMRAQVRRVEADWSRRVGADRVQALRETLRDLIASVNVEA